MLDAWDSRFPNCPPIGYRLREAFPERWIRFHSLPESKRYPEDEAEYRIVLDRHNSVLGDLMGGTRRVVLLTTGYAETPQPVRTYAQLDSLDPDAEPWRAIDMQAEREFSEPTYWHIFAREWEWQWGLFDPLIRLVADDAVADVMIVEPECKWVLHPYDGGMDVIAETPAVRTKLRTTYREWLSARADGL